MRRSQLQDWGRKAGVGLWRLLTYAAGRLFRSVLGEPQEVAVIVAAVGLSLMGLLAIAFVMTFGQSHQWVRMMEHVNREWSTIAFPGGIAGYIIAKRRSRWAEARRAARRAANCCIRCGYDLTANTSGVCPECGKRI
jgi:hypothetical protein